MQNLPTPGGEAGYSPDQLIEMASNITGCRVELGAILPLAFAVSAGAQRILIDRKVPGHFLAATLVGAIHRLFSEKRISSEDTQPLQIPANVVTMRRRGGLLS